MSDDGGQETQFPAPDRSRSNFYGRRNLSTEPYGNTDPTKDLIALSKFLKLLSQETEDAQIMRLSMSISSCSLKMPMTQPFGRWTFSAKATSKRLLNNLIGTTKSLRWTPPWEVLQLRQLHALNSPWGIWPKRRALAARACPPMSLTMRVLAFIGSSSRCALGPAEPWIFLTLIEICKY